MRPLLTSLSAVALAVPLAAQSALVNQHLGPLEFTPDSTRVVFTTNSGLWSAPIDGSAAAVQLSGGVTLIEAFALTPDSTRVVYRSGRLYSASVLGGTPVDLSGTLVSGGSVTGFALSVNGERVVYRADRFVDERFLLSSVPVDGGVSTILNGPMVGGGDVSGFQVSPDGIHVVYRADQDVDNDERLYRVPVNGSAPAVLLNQQDLDFAPFAIAPDGAHLVVSFGGLQSLPITGGSLVELSPSASTFLFADGGQRVLHVEAERLKLTPIEGGRSETLNPPPAGELWEFALDGDRVVYRAEQDESGAIEIYSSLLQPVEHTPLPSGRPIRR